MREDAAVNIPPKNCAFKGCAAQFQTQPELDAHVANAHADVLHPVSHLLEEPACGRAVHGGSSQDALTAAYHEAISTVVRRGAPLAAWSIDRRCLYNYMAALGDDAVESLICFCCAF